MGKFPELEKYVFYEDVQQAEELHRRLIQTNSDLYSQVYLSLVLAEIYQCNLRFIDSLRVIKDALTKLSNSEANDYMPPKKIQLPFFEIPVSRDSSKPTYKHYDLYTYGLIIQAICYLELGELGHLRDTFRQLEEYEKDLDHYIKEQLLSKYEDAEIIHYLRKGSPSNAPSLEEIQNKIIDLSSDQPLNSIMITFADSLPVTIQIQFIRSPATSFRRVRERPLLTQPATEVELKEKDKLTVGKKIKRALRRAFYGRVCENPKVKDLISTGGIAAFITSIYQARDITNLNLIAGTISGFSLFGIDFLCSLLEDKASK